MGSREALKVLQGQFEHAAKEFPGMMHIIAQTAKDGMHPIVPGKFKGSPPQQRSKDGMYPIIPDGLDSANYCPRFWDKNMRREPDERGYPAWHWLRAPFSQQWDMQLATARFDILATEIGEAVAAMDDSVLPISKAKLWVRRPAEYWVLLLHHFKLKPHWTMVNREGTCTSTMLIRGLFGMRPYTFTHKTLLSGEPPETRLAKEGESHIYWLDDVYLASALAIGELLSRLSPPAIAHGDAEPANDAGQIGGTATKATPKNLLDWAGGSEAIIAIVHTDITGSTQMCALLGNQKMKELLDVHFTQARHLAESTGGYLFKTVGDGSFAAFRTASDALRFALELRGDPGDACLHIRAGVHMGSVIISEHDADGTAMNYTARVLDEARPAKVCLSNEAKKQIDEQGDHRLAIVTFTMRLNCKLKDIPGEQTLWFVEAARQSQPSSGQGAELT
jgi:class 3 adenylate cyclase